MNFTKATPAVWLPEKKLSPAGFSLTELLCVLGVLGILAGLYLGVIVRAFLHVKKFLEHLAGH